MIKASLFARHYARAVRQCLIFICTSMVIFLLILIVSIDASHGGHTAFCPAIENMTVATRKASSRPIFRGPSGTLSHQSRQNIVHVHSLKRMRYRAGTRLPLNPNEKNPKANGFVATTWAQYGSFFPHLLKGNVVLSLCGGSGSLMEACTHTGRSCIMLEIDGNFLF